MRKPQSKKARKLSRRHRRDQPLVEFPEGKPVRLTLSYDHPKSGLSSRGRWWRYAVEGGYFFAEPALQGILEPLGLRKGDAIEVTNLGGGRWQARRPGREQGQAAAPESPTVRADDLLDALKSAALIAATVPLEAALKQGWKSEDVRALGITLYLARQ